MACGKFQTGLIAVRKLMAVCLGQATRYDGTDGMKDVPARKIKGRCQLSRPGRLRIPLFFHDGAAEQAQLYAAECMNAVVDAAVVRDVAAGHAAVCRIDDGIAFQRRNIALPKINAV